MDLALLAMAAIAGFAVLACLRLIAADLERTRRRRALLLEVVARRRAWIEEHERRARQKALFEHAESGLALPAEPPAAAA